MTLYRQPSRPVAVGELRTRTWRTVPGVDIAPDDPIWSARCKQYWELQARLYGWRMSNYTFAVDMEGGFVSTYSAVLEILPGERTAEHWLVPVESAQIAPLVMQ